jgi:hypothetical protein
MGFSSCDLMENRGSEFKVHVPRDGTTLAVRMNLYFFYIRAALSTRKCTKITMREPNVKTH